MKENVVLCIVLKNGVIDVLFHQFQILSIDGIKWSVSHSFTYERKNSAYFVWKDMCKDDQQDMRVATRR